MIYAITGLLVGLMAWIFWPQRDDERDFKEFERELLRRGLERMNQ